MNAPAGYRALLAPLPEGVVMVGSEETQADVVQVFVRDTVALERYAPLAVGAVKPGGLLWVCYPKGGKKAGTDLHRDTLWDVVGRQTGLVGVTLIAIDETWSAMRFRRADQVGR